jgi:hypothetical protein
LSHHLSLHHHTVGSAFLLALTPLSSSRCFCHCAAAPFIVLPSLPSSLCRQFCLCYRAAAAFFVKPPFHSLSRCQFCLRHRANASSAFVVAPPLPSLSHCCCFCHRAAARFIVAPPLYFFFLTSSHLDCPQINPIALPIHPLQVSHSPLFVAVTSQSPPIAPPLPSSPAADFILKSPLSTFFHHLSLHHHAAGSAFLLALTPPSSSRCFRHCAQFIVAPPLPSSLHRQFCLCHCS